MSRAQILGRCREIALVNQMANGNTAQTTAQTLRALQGPLGKRLTQNQTREKLAAQLRRIAVLAGPYPCSTRGGVANRFLCTAMAVFARPPEELGIESKINVEWIYRLTFIPRRELWSGSIRVTLNRTH